MSKAVTPLKEALDQIVAEKGIDIDLVFEAIESSLELACKKNYGANTNFKILMDRETGEMNCFAQLEVVEEVENAETQLQVNDAKAIKVIYEVGDIVDIPVRPKDFGRIAAQTAKQVILQKLREAEREIIYNEYITKEKQMLTGIVQRKERKNVIITLGKIEAVMGPMDQMPNEEYAFSSRVRVYVTEVKQTNKGPVINVSRTKPELVAKLFEQEVPEMYDGIVSIVSISREAGQRTKMAVTSSDPDIDPVGACVGPAGSRVNVIVAELKGEKIDIIKYSEDPSVFIETALSPSKVIEVTINEEEKTARVIVPKHQLSLAIGKDGQNARLAARLTGYKIDIKSEEYYEQNIEKEYEEYYTQNENEEDGEYEEVYEDEYEGDVYNSEDANIETNE